MTGAGAAARAEGGRAMERGGGDARRDGEAFPPFVTPVELVLAADVAARAGISAAEGAEGQDPFTRVHAPRVRRALFDALGVVAPLARVRVDEGLPPGRYAVHLSAVPVRVDALDHLSGEPARDHLAAALLASLRGHARELVGLQEVQAMLDAAEKRSPALVREVVPKLVSLQLLTDVLRRLVEEEVSLRDLRAILGALADWARAEKDPVLLTEHVRAALRRALTHDLAGGADTLRVLLLDPFLEDTLRGAIQRLPTGSYLALDPEASQDIVAAVRREAAAFGDGARPVVLTTLEVRRFLKKLCEVELPDLAVVSYQELTPELRIQPVARVQVG